ncbi:single-strand binding protein [Toxoplasma gondii ARI]|uniref:Single-strand binding protein n=1 Tax=Toxoplasma gondii ARI TaxID=1074872 RepID=A0A139XUD8_TOXGO|nr:single-strand binding protein [Toxoplasma gondii ARI]
MIEQGSFSSSQEDMWRKVVSTSEGSKHPLVSLHFAPVVSPNLHATKGTTTPLSPMLSPLFSLSSGVLRTLSLSFVARSSLFRGLVCLPQTRFWSFLGSFLPLVSMAAQSRARGGLGERAEETWKSLRTSERHPSGSVCLLSSCSLSPSRPRPVLFLLSTLLVCFLWISSLCPDSCFALSGGPATSRTQVLELPSMLSSLSRTRLLNSAPLCRSQSASTVPFSLHGGIQSEAVSCRRLGFVAPSVAKMPRVESVQFSRGRIAGGLSCASTGTAPCPPVHAVGVLSKRNSCSFSTLHHLQNVAVEQHGGSDLKQVTRVEASQSQSFPLASFHVAPRSNSSSSRLNALRDEPFSPGASSSPSRTGRRGGPLRHAEMSVNRVTLLGRLGNMPEIRRMSNGDTFAWFSMATSVNWIDKATGDAHSRTEWHRVVVYDESLVDLVDKYLHTGRRVFVTGKLQTRRWTGADGVDRYSTSVVVSRLQGELIILDSPSSSFQSNYSSASESGQPGTSDWASGDLGAPDGEGSGDASQALGAFGDSGSDGQGSSGPTGSGTGGTSLDGSASGGMYRLFR